MSMQHFIFLKKTPTNPKQNQTKLKTPTQNSSQKTYVNDLREYNLIHHITENKFKSWICNKAYF